MSFSSGFSGNQDNEEFMQALDKVYNEPTFNRKAFQKNCLNSAKTSKIGGNDYNCTQNLEKLFLECERLSDIATQKTNQLTEMQKELDALKKDKSSSGDAKSAAEQLKQQKLEIDYLKVQLQKKEEENKVLKEDKARILKEQMATLNKIQTHAAIDSVDGTFRIEDLDRVIYEAFNNDLPKRLDFIAKILDWQRFSAVARGLADAEPYNPEVQDGELACEHFSYRKSHLNLMMDKVYFPTIDAQEHLEMYRAHDFAIKLEHEKYHDHILVEMITLQNILKQLGYDAIFTTPGQQTYIECRISEHDRMIIGGLLKRLLNMIPVRQKGDKYVTKDFNSKMSNLYFMLRQRTSIKNAFEVSLDISTQKAQEDIDTICERILSCILDYDDYCRAKEEEARHKNEMPQRILNLFQQKISQKMINLKKLSDGMKKGGYSSSMINK